MIDSCRQYYQSNIKELKSIDEFEQEYQSNEAIDWYLKKTFLYRMVNKALHTMNFD
jgi:hypothetical protein